MITQTQFPFEALMKTAISSGKLFAISLTVAVVLGGLLLLVRAFLLAKNKKLAQGRFI